MSQGGASMADKPKVLWRKDWLRIEKGLGNWGIKDLWGDYELILGASKLHLEIVEVPVHYQERILRRN
jgi:hypothetical protein